MEIQEKLADFAYISKRLEGVEGYQGGNELVICGVSYKAWDYDTYIYDAIEIAKNWKLEEINYDRIVHVRGWLREYWQHGHNLPIDDLKSMQSVKDFIDNLIVAEYSGTDDEKELIESNQKANHEVF